MSSTTIPLTSNPTASPAVLALGATTRRHTTTTNTQTQKRSNLDLLSDANASSEARTEAFLEKSKDLAKKSQTLAQSPRPRRKSTPKTSPPERPKWVRVGSVLLKNLVLLIMLLGLVQMVSRLMGYKHGVLPVSRVMEIESRIGEIEDLVTRTSKMAQVQFDVLDKKIEVEVGEVRKELLDRSGILEEGLRRVEERSGAVEKTLRDSGVGVYKFLTKEDFERFEEELRSSRGEGKEEEVGVSLDEIRGMARDIVLKEIEKHNADGLGRLDYAVASGGARVVFHSDPLYGNSLSWLKNQKSHDIAQRMLQPSFGEPGQCFPLKGGSGFAVVSLRAEIIPEAITLEHVAKSVAYDRSSAPKDCRVYGWFQARGADQSTLPDKKLLLAEFTYDLEKSSNVQTFNVDPTIGGVINMVQLEFTSNYGAPHTCIYRLRVHGQQPDSVAVSTLHN